MSEPQFESEAHSMHGPLTLARWHSYGFDEELMQRHLPARPVLFEAVAAIGILAFVDLHAVQARRQ